MSNRTTIETIKQKLPIESVVGSYIKLERAGKNFKARCPFHNEKTASFQVTPDLGIYKCFGCQKGGDIFSFVEEIEGIPFYEALVSLAEKAGVPLDNNNQDGEKHSKSAVLRQIMDLASKVYEVNLRKTPAVVEYLLSRGVTKETIVAWRIGFAQKGWSHLSDFLVKKFPGDDIVAVGLGIKGDRGVYDRFRERIMFPISDGQGRVVAFTGRVLPGTEEAEKPVGKYINSPETALYHKSNILFGFDKAKSFIHSDGFAILVEGQMDCIMSHQAGIKNTVAISGTAATDDHMRMISRFTDDIAIALDADAAGLAAAQRTAITAYRNDMRVSVIAIPNGKDPADTIREDGNDWKKAIANRRDFITFRLDRMKSAGDSDKVAVARKELFPILREFTSQIRVDDKLQEIARAFNQSSVDPVRRDYEEFLKQNPVEPKPVEAPIAPQRRDAKSDAVGIILTLNDGADAATAKELFESILGEPFDGALAALSETERAERQVVAQMVLGSSRDDFRHVQSRLKHLLLQHRLDMLDLERKRIEQALADDPANTAHLHELSELVKSRDALIHQLTH